jgi:hypothetical protein
MILALRPPSASSDPTARRMHQAAPVRFDVMLEGTEEIMNSKWTLAASAAMGTMLIAGAANAQQAPRDEAQSTSDKSRDLPAATHAVELTVGTGYAQGFGNVGAQQSSLTDIGTAGGEVQLGASYRLLPPLGIGVYGSGAAYGRGSQVDSTANLYSATAGVQGDWHFLPAASEWDPWVSLGTGWRGYWLNNSQGTSSLHGWQIARLQVGVDYRIAPAVSISPVIGADLSMFFTQSSPQSTAFSSVSSPDVNTFVFGGLLGRFDIPTESPSSSVASR